MGLEPKALRRFVTSVHAMRPLSLLRCEQVLDPFTFPKEVAKIAKKSGLACVPNQLGYLT